MRLEYFLFFFIMMQCFRSGTQLEIGCKQQKRESRISENEESVAPHMQLQSCYELPAQNENVLQPEIMKHAMDKVFLMIF